MELIGKMIVLGPAHVDLRENNQKEILPLCWIACWRKRVN